MKLNRRNALLGIGAIATGGGALFGSGAFSQVQADRAVNLSVSGDSSALLQLKAGSGATGIIGTTQANQSSVDELVFSESQLNADAKTKYNDALEALNNGDETGITLYVDSSDTGVGSVIDFKNGGSSIVGSSTSSGVKIDTAKNISVIVDLTGGNDVDNIGGTVTFIAE